MPIVSSYGLGEVTHENLLNSPSRGNLVDGLPRAASLKNPVIYFSKLNIRMIVGTNVIHSVQVSRQSIVCAPSTILSKRAAPAKITLFHFFRKFEKNSHPFQELSPDMKRASKTGLETIMKRLRPLI